MASSDRGSIDSARQPSFAIRDYNPQSSRLLPRSLSLKDISFTFSQLSPYDTPPRRSLQNPRFSEKDENNETDLDRVGGSSHMCTHSVVKKRAGNVLNIRVWNNLVYTCSDTNFIGISKMPGFKEMGLIKCKNRMVSALEVVNNRVFGACSDGKIRVWKRTWDGDTKHVRFGTIPNRKGSVFSYISGKDKTIKHTAPITSLAVNLVNGVLYSASLDKTVKVWRLSGFECLETIRAHTEPVNAVVASSTDGLLYTASDDATIGVWKRDFYHGDHHGSAHVLVAALHAKQSPVKTLTLAYASSNPDSNVFLYAGCTDGYVYYWNATSSTKPPQYSGALRGHTHAVMSLASIGCFIVSGSADSTARVWTREGEGAGQHVCLAVLTGHRSPIRSVAAFFEDEEEMEDRCTVITGSMDRALRVWKVTRRMNPGRDERQNSFDFSRQPQP